jgi:Rrf2 family protein
MRIQIQTEYAICILVYLASKGNSTQKEMMADLGIDEHYISHIVQLLKNRNWIVLMPGNNGGVALEEEPDNITLLDIIEVTDNISNINFYTEKNNLYTQDRTTNDIMRQLRRDYDKMKRTHFSSITLGDLLETGENNTGKTFNGS